MPIFAPITDLSFFYDPYHLSHTIKRDLNKVYLEQFKDSQFNNLFTDGNHTAIKSNVIALLRNNIATIINNISQADRSVIDLLINPLPMYVYDLDPKRRFVICNAATFATTLTATIQFISTHLAVQLDTAALLIFDGHSPLDFTGFSTT